LDWLVVCRSLEKRTVSLRMDASFKGIITFNGPKSACPAMPAVALLRVWEIDGEASVR
jgi:hypothetical protein